MNVLQILNKLYRHLEDISSEAPVTTTIVSSTKDSITLADPIGAQGTRDFHVLWPLPLGSNVWANEPLIIATNPNTTTVQIFGGMDMSNKIPDGTTVRIDSGYLQDAKKYFLEPDNVSSLEASGIEHFLTVGIMDQSISQDTLGRVNQSTNYGRKTQSRQATVGVLTEVLDKNPGSSAVLKYAHKMKPHVFSEQVIAKMYTFLREECQGVYGYSDIAVEYGAIARDGSESEVTLVTSHTMTFTIK